MMLAAPALADVTYSQVTKTSGMMKMFGGGQHKTVTQISGDKMRTESEDDVQIVDLGTERIYNLNKKKKTYTVMTFEEMKKKMEEGMASANESMKQGKGEEGADVSAQARFKVTDTGNTETIKGYPCTQYLMEMAVDIEDKKSQQEGSFSTLTEMWLSKEVPGVDEINAFHRKMAEKLGTTAIGRQMTSGNNEQANAFAANMREMADEMKKMDGFSVRSVMYFGSPEAAKKEALGGGGADSKEEQGGGGLGGFMKKMKMPGGGAGGGVLTKITTEIDTIETKAIDPSVFAVPDGYKQVTQ
jgi:hypothetical protein